MNAKLKDAILTTVIVIILVYIIEYGISLFQGYPFQRPSTAALLAAVIAANISRQRRKRS